MVESICYGVYGTRYINMRLLCSGAEAITRGILEIMLCPSGERRNRVRLM